MANHIKNSPLIVLITGVSGSGKTTVVKTLEKDGSPELVSIHYFDDMGIPSIEQMIKEQGSVEKWQEWATHTWIKKIVKIRAPKLVLLEGSFNPGFAVAQLKELNHNSYKLICLHTDRVMREKRLKDERLQPELATQDMENFAQFLKAKTIDLGGNIVDTTHLSLKEVCKKIRRLIEEEENGISL